MLNWKKKKINNISIIYIINGTPEDELINIVKLYFKNKNLLKISTKLNNLPGFFSFIAQKGELKVACVDRIRSFPILYDKKKNQFLYGKKIQQIKFKKKDLENDALKLFSLSGFTPNNLTLKKNLFQLEAGDLILLNKKKLEKVNILTNRKKRLSKKSRNELFREFDNNLNKVFKRLKKIYKNYKFVLSLSGGYDSRLILSKIIENGFSNFYLITYGAKNNYDSLIAKKICKELNLKLTTIEFNKKFLRKNFNLISRKLYWKQSHNFTSLPNMQEYMVLKYLISNKLIDNKCVFLNGQTGDFLSGEHLSKSNSKNEIIDRIIKKHFNLDTSVKINGEIKILIRKSINYHFKENKKLKENKLKEYFWEWKERQAKYVVNQQRTYEFFNQAWYLPFWDKEITEFFKSLSVNDLMDQKFYKEYLNSYNYKNLFKNKFEKSNYTNWIGILKYLFIPAKFVEVILGKRSKGIFYNFFKYFDKYSYHYQVFSYFNFLKNIKKLRNANSFYIREFIYNFINIK